MSQEYTEDKEIVLKKLSNGRRLLEALLVIIAAFAVYLMVALLSFNPSDPSWSQTAWHEPIHNLAGGMGAWFADTLLFIFGVLAFAIPSLIIIFCIAVYFQYPQADYIDFFSLSLRLIGVLALILSSCGLAALNIDDLYYFASGGVIGSLLSNAILPWFSTAGATLLLLCIWAAGFTLFTGWSWLVIAEKIGSVILNFVAFITHRSQHHELEEITQENIAKYEGDDPLFTQMTTAHQPSVSFDNAITELPSSTGVNCSEIAVEQNNIDKQSVAIGEPPISIEQESLAPKEQEQVAQHLDNEPQLGDWRNILSAQPAQSAKKPTALQDKPNSDDFSAATDVNISSTEAVFAPATTAPFMPVLGEEKGVSSQVKQGIGPELPRPNPVRIPTRRELASYGIQLPSKRLAEQKQRAQQMEAQEQNQDLDAIQEEALRQAFIEQQKLRYSESAQEQQKAIASQAALIKPQASQAPLTREHAQLVDSAKLAYENREQQNSPAQFSYETVVKASIPSSSGTQQSATSPDILQSQIDDVRSSSVKADNMASTVQQSLPESLIHPFLMRNEHSLPKPTTPLPTLNLLAAAPAEVQPVDMFALEQKARLVEACLADFRVKADVVDILPGPVITRFELELAPGVKAARISNLSRDLARSLSTSAVRVVEVIPGRPYVGLELPNIKRQTVYLREVLDCPAFRDNSSPLAIVLGKDISGNPVVADLAKMPHLLVAGTTGSGKSVGVNAMILSMLYKATPKEVRFIMIDPKMLELSVYEGIPHLLTDVVTDMKDAANALRWCVAEMERRYKLMSALGVRNIAGYNERIEQANAMGRPVPDPFWKPSDSMDINSPVLEKEPYIVVMVDEFADLMMTVGKKVEELIARLAQKARAAGIHLVLATQRPSVDVITGLIKANIPTRIAFTVSSKIDSRTILDQGGAESLLGMGDMLYLAPNSSIPVRVHGAFVRDQEVHAVVNDWKARERPQYKEGILNVSESESGASFDGGEELDPLFDQAVEFVVEKRRASISGVQRQFRIGYNRAARIIEQMEAQGIVSAQGHNGNREVLAPPAHN